jgi:hypothetical protein
MTTTNSIISDDTLATYLIQKGHFLTALEFHQELLEGNNGVHSVATLNRFFGDSQNFEKLVAKVTESEEAANSLQHRTTSSSSGECMNHRHNLLTFSMTN